MACWEPLLNTLQVALQTNQCQIVICINKWPAKKQRKDNIRQKQRNPNFILDVDMKEEEERRDFSL